jgi:uncharacterized protein
MGNGGEPSVEEILESIKKVIARDNRAGAIEARRRREPIAADSEAALISEPPPATDPAHVVHDEPGVLDLTDMELAAASGVDDNAEIHDAETDADEAPLIAKAVRQAMQENLAALAMLAEPGAKPQIVRSGETSLEGLTRDLLRPMLAEWLDAHLPAMVERMVQSEIARIAGKRV